MSVVRLQEEIFSYFFQLSHTMTDWMASAGAKPSFIASQMGRENAKMVYEVYSKWIVGMNADQAGMLSERLQTLLPQDALRDKRHWIMSFKISKIATSYKIP